MENQVSTSVITERHVEITDLMLEKVKAFITESPTIQSYQASSRYDHEEAIELSKDNTVLRIQLIRRR